MRNSFGVLVWFHSKSYFLVKLFFQKFKIWKEFNLHVLWSDQIFEEFKQMKGEKKPKIYPSWCHPVKKSDLCKVKLNKKKRRLITSQNSEAVKHFKAFNSVEGITSIEHSSDVHWYIFQLKFHFSRVIFLCMTALQMLSFAICSSIFVLTSRFSYLIYPWK